MWISRKRFEALERRVEELANTYKDTQRQLTIYGPNEGYGFYRFPSEYSVRDVLSMLLDRLGLELKTTSAVPESKALVKKPK